MPSIKHWFMSVLLLTAVPVAADQITVTIYNQDLALINQTRTIDLNVPDKRLLITDIPAKIIPSSVHMQPRRNADVFRIIEQNFEYDVITPDKLLRRYLGRPVEVVATDGKLITGRLLNYQQNTLILQTGDHIQMVDRNEDIRLRFKQPPGDFYSKPTLVWHIQKARQAKAKIDLSYLTRGLSWQAAYVGVLDAEDNALDVGAWAVIHNQSGAEFANAGLSLVAGEVKRVTPPPPLKSKLATRSLAASLDEAAPLEQKSFFEYHRYDLKGRTTLLRDQKKQVALFNNRVLPSRRIYRYAAHHHSKKVTVALAFENKAAGDASAPMPAGVFRVYRRDGDSETFVGEDRLPHTPAGAEAKIAIGMAFDLQAERKVITQKRLAKRSMRQQVEIELRNFKKKKDVAINVEERFNYRDWQIEATDFKYTRKDTRTAEFKVPVKANTRTTLRYTVLMSW